MSKKSFENLAATIPGIGSPIAYYPTLSRCLGNQHAGMLLGQLMYWTPRGRKKGWVYKTRNEMEEETGLSRDNQETARRVLREAGLLHEELKGVPATIHFKLDLPRLRQMFGQSPTGLRESTQPVCGKAPNWLATDPQTITEITSETSSESIPERKEREEAPASSLSPFGDSEEEKSEEPVGVSDDVPELGKEKKTEKTESAEELGKDEILKWYRDLVDSYYAETAYRVDDRFLGSQYRKKEWRTHLRWLESEKERDTDFWESYSIFIEFARVCVEVWGGEVPLRPRYFKPLPDSLRRQWETIIPAFVRSEPNCKWEFLLKDSDDYVDICDQEPENVGAVGCAVAEDDEFHGLGDDLF